MSEPTTDAGRVARERLAYHIDPAHYAPGDYSPLMDDVIAAIEAEARAAERERILRWLDGVAAEVAKADVTVAYKAGATAVLEALRLAI